MGEKGEKGEKGDLRVMKKKTHYLFPCVWSCGDGKCRGKFLVVENAVENSWGWKMPWKILGGINHHHNATHKEKNNVFFFS